MEKVDITIIGAGVVGLACAYQLAQEGHEIIVVEKHMAFGQETSSRNSEVIHAGLYYEPNSLKARTCIRGKELLYTLCARHTIPHKKLGKLIIGIEQEEIEKLHNIKNNAEACGVTNLRFLEKDECRRLEPNVKAEAILLSPDTGIIDSHSLMKFFETFAKDKGVEFAYGIEIIGIEKSNAGYRITVKEPEGDEFSFETKTVINAAGLCSDKIAALAGIDTVRHNYQIHFCKGQYFRLINPARFQISHPVYPPPSAIDLGIHITPDLAGGLRLGPDAEYIDQINYDIKDADREKFFQSVRRFLPMLQKEDIIPDTAGIRSKLQQKNEAFRDFVIINETEKGLESFINLIGIESPGLTACLAIAEKVKEILRKRN